MTTNHPTQQLQSIPAETPLRNFRARFLLSSAILTVLTEVRQPESFKPELYNADRLLLISGQAPKAYNLISYLEREIHFL